MTIHGAEKLTWFRSSEKVQRGFCSICGSALFWDPIGKDIMAVGMGAFDLPTYTKLEMHIFVANKGDYSRSRTACRSARSRRRATEVPRAPRSSDQLRAPLVELTSDSGSLHFARAPEADDHPIARSLPRYRAFKHGEDPFASHNEGG